MRSIFDDFVQLHGAVTVHAARKVLETLVGVASFELATPAV